MSQNQAIEGRATVRLNVPTDIIEAWKASFRAANDEARRRAAVPHVEPINERGWVRLAILTATASLALHAHTRPTE